MEKIIYTDPYTFEDTELEFSDFHYKLAENIKEYIKEKYLCTDNLLSLEKQHYISTVMPITDNTKLVIGLMLDRKNGETVAEKYNIIIEKISEAE